MKSTKQILVEFIDSFNSDELHTVLHSGIDIIFENSVAATSSDMYSNGVHSANLNTTDNDEGTNTYLGSEQENFGSDDSDLIDELDLFDIENVTIHGTDDTLKQKFQNTQTYQTIIPQIKSMADSHKLMHSHLNRTDTTIKILKA